ncbi:MAG: DUF1761 domain-containing protein [Ardenticatenales bacterium]
MGLALFEHVSWWAIAGCVVASMALGFVWYMWLFGKQWVALMGWSDKSEAEMKELQSGATPGYVVMAVSAVIMALVLHATLHATGAATMGSAMVVAALLWLGFVATSTLGTAMFSLQNMRLWFLNQAYVLVQMMIMAAILVRA